MIKGKKGELILKDFAMLGLVFALLFAAIVVLVVDMDFHNPDVEEAAPHLERYVDAGFINQTRDDTEARISETREQETFTAELLQTLDIVRMIPSLIRLPWRSVLSIRDAVSEDMHGILPTQVITIMFTMALLSLLWVIVYFIRRLGK